MTVYIVKGTEIMARITNVTVVPRVSEKITIEHYGTFIVKNVHWHLNPVENFINVKVE